MPMNDVPEEKGLGMPLKFDRLCEEKKRRNKGQRAEG